VAGAYNMGPRAVPAAGDQQRHAADSVVSFCYFHASEAGVDLMLRRARQEGPPPRAPTAAGRHSLRSSPSICSRTAGRYAVGG
jgi:hypothetical protein